MSWQELFSSWAFELTVASVVTFLIGLVAMRFAVIYMPADYFVRNGPPPTRWIGHHPALRWTLIVLKNVLGVICLLTGLVMLVVPGPGVMMLLLGLSLTDIPGKRGLERRLISIGPVHRKIDKLRRKHGQQPLQLGVPQLTHQRVE